MNTRDASSLPIALAGGFELDSTQGSRALRARFRVSAPIVFQPRWRASFELAGGTRVASDSSGMAENAWLPRGDYRLRLELPPDVAAPKARVRLESSHKLAMVDTPAGAHEQELAIAPGSSGAAWAWSLEAVPPTPAIETLSWKKGAADWFFRHFDHAAPTVMSYLLGDHPMLRGRILDVGCGDGITDLGIALRTGCAELVGIDPFRQFDKLPQIVAENHLPPDAIPPTLRFMAEDANFLPFPDDAFDVVISWGSVEHIAGGYLQALREMKRVLKHDGLLMVAPGLFYSNIGHHLGEFSEEPFFHLKKSREEIRAMVLATPPRYIDRSGIFATNEQYWQWFTELNPITVARFEQELRALEFRPWRIALRTDNLVEYTPEIEHYPIQDLANIELYSSWINRKPKRP